MVITSKGESQTFEIDYCYNKYGFAVLGESFDFMDGIFGMALSPYKYGEDRVLYFHSLASITENYVYTSVLRNNTLFRVNADAANNEFNTFPFRRLSQASIEAIDDKGIMYFGSIEDSSIVCWNTNTEFSTTNFHILDKNWYTLQFPSAVKVRLFSFR